MKLNYFNFINLLRHVAALLVIYAHSFVLMKTDSVDYFESVLGINPGTFAVNIFFFLSGMLIYTSAVRSKGMLNYYFKRVLRIYPALIVCVFVTIVAFWIDSPYSFTDFFTQNTSINYMLNILFIGKYSAYEIFKYNYYPDVANGSLWTLRYEILMYIIVSFFALKVLKYKKSALIGIFIVFLLLYVFYLHAEKSMISNIINLGVYFFCGAILGDFSLLDRRKNVILILVVVLIGIQFFPNLRKVFDLVLICVPLKYLLDYIRHTEKDRSKINFDISYGLYIYAFPIQQFLVKYVKFENVYLYFIIASILTIIIASLSWFLVEKKFLKLKNAIKK